MAAEHRRADDTSKRRPSSAPKTSEMTNIPKIVLEDKEKIDPDVCVVSSRAQTDMGLPASSMPNLALDRFGENNPGGSENLGVFCSPRMTRRSVDLDVSGRNHNEWLEDLDQTNSLKVLSSSSRVGSAISLNSECTARSIGLISNDSSSDSTSVSEKFNEQLPNEKSAHLRRLMSYPEQDDRTNVEAAVTRTSQSCANLKAVQQNDSVNSGEGTRDRLLLPSESTETNSEDGVDKNFDDIKDEKCRQHIVCYKKGPKYFRDGRIRQWLQDMDPQDKVAD